MAAAESIVLQAERERRSVASLRSYMLGTGVALALLLGILYVALLTAGLSLQGWDFLFLYSPGKLLLQGHAAQLYDYHVISRIEAVVVYPLQMHNGGMPNVYPPYAAALYSPLALLPYNPAYFIWTGINGLLLLWSMYRLERYTGLTGRPAFAARLAALLFIPLLVALLQGQTTLVVLAAWTLAFFALQRDADVPAGIALGASLIKPQYILPWLLVLVLSRRWKALASFGAVALALVALSVATAGPAIVPAYLHSLVQAGNPSHEFGLFDDTYNRGFAAFFNMILPAGPARIMTFGADLCAIALLALYTLRRRALDVSLGLATVVALLVSPHVLIHDLALLLIPFAVMLRYTQHRSEYLGVAAIYAIVTAGFLLTFEVRFQFPTVAVAALAVWLLRTHPLPEVAAERSARVLRIVPRLADPPHGTFPMPGAQDQGDRRALLS